MSKGRLPVTGYVAVMVVLAAVASHASSTGGTEQQKASASALANKRLDVIVGFKTAKQIKDLRRIETLGFNVKRDLPLINSVSGSVRLADLPRLRQLGNVRQITVDRVVEKTDAFTVASSDAGAAYSQYGYSGAGVGVAVLDSGIHGNPDLNKTLATDPGNRLVQSVDFTGLGTDDQCGHGTHVAGIIGGNGSQSTGKDYTKTFYGIAQSARLISVRVLNAQGGGSESNVIAGLQWCVQNASKYNIRVINISLGCSVTQSYKTDPLCKAVEAAWKAGIVVVCAAGNNGRLFETQFAGLNNQGFGTAYGSIECPGNDPYVITVGATKSVDGNRVDDEIATYSGRGPSASDLILKPDLVAPGNLVVSTEDTGHSYLISTYGSAVEIQNSSYSSKPGGGSGPGGGNTYSNSYFVLSGTSMATPVVAGAVAMMLSAQPKLSPDTIKARLMVSATKWTNPNGTGDACTFGAGYVNVQAAMGSTVVATTPALSPSLSQSQPGTWLVNLDPTVYGQRAMWGTGITNLQTIYGSSSISASTLAKLSPNRAMWGTGLYSYLQASSITGVDCTSSSVLVKGE